jgi:predicted TIM-barrel fold metal-dependent hydrolase
MSVPRSRGTSNPQWSVDSIKPIVDFVINAFGPERCMFASNFPVESLMRGYIDVWSAFDQVVCDYSEQARDSLFFKTATRIYRI